MVLFTVYPEIINRFKFTLTRGTNIHTRVLEIQSTQYNYPNKLKRFITQNIHNQIFMAKTDFSSIFSNLHIFWLYLPSFLWERREIIFHPA